MASTKSPFYSFPYVKFHERYYPLIPLSLRSGKNKVNTFALLDSGASISVFRPEIAYALGLKRKKKKPIYLGTADGGVHIVVHKVEVRVERTKFQTKLGFPGKKAPSFNILGREGFFSHFVISFNEIMKTVIMVPVGKKK